MTLRVIGVQCNGKVLLVKKLVPIFSVSVALSSDLYIITLHIEHVLNKPTKTNKQRFDYDKR